MAIVITLSLSIQYFTQAEEVSERKKLVNRVKQGRQLEVL